MDVTISNLYPVRENGVITAVKVEFNASMKGGEVNLSGHLVIDDLEAAINFDEINSKIKQKLANDITGE